MDWLVASVHGHHCFEPTCPSHGNQSFNPAVCESAVWTILGFFKVAGRPRLHSQCVAHSVCGTERVVEWQETVWTAL